MTTRTALVHKLPETGPISCPRRGCKGEIMEEDSAVRWNEITVETDGEGRTYLHASTAGEADFHHAGWRCTGCLGLVDFAPGVMPMGENTWNPGTFYEDIEYD